MTCATECCIPAERPTPHRSPLTWTSTVSSSRMPRNSSAVTTTEPSAVPKSLDLAGPMRPSTISRNCTSRALKSLSSTKAADRGEGLLAGQVGAVPGDDDANLKLVVQRLGVGRPADGIAVADERGRVALVVQRLLVPQRAGTQPRERAPGQPLVTVAHRPGDGLTQPQQAAGHTDHVLGPQRAVAERRRTERRGGRG